MTDKIKNKCYVGIRGIYTTIFSLIDCNIDWIRTTDLWVAKVNPFDHWAPNELFFAVQTFIAIHEKFVTQQSWGLRSHPIESTTSEAPKSEIIEADVNFCQTVDSGGCLGGIIFYFYEATMIFRLILADQKD